MSERKNDSPRGARVDYSEVTPATGTNPDNIQVADSLANQMPTADSPSSEHSMRTDPDKTIPGSEAASSVDEAEASRGKKGK